jgi:hypothetical protein
MKRYCLCSYRNIRKRSLEDCVEDTRTLFAGLAALDGEMFRWKKRGWSKTKAMSHPLLDIEDREILRGLLLKGVNHTDYPKEPIPELGYHIGLWNGNPKDEASANLSLSNGSYAKTATNAFVLQFPDHGRLDADDALAQRMMQLAVDVLDAEWAVLYHDHAGFARPDDLFLDRALYISNRMRWWGLKYRSFLAQCDRTIRTPSGRLYFKGNLFP